MIVLKFEKISTAALVSHIDNLRAVTYALRRAGIDVEYSQGYNPHMELGFSSPLALGVESIAEYVSLKTAYAVDLLDRLNAVCPEGLSFTRIFDVADVNLAAVINRAEYTVYADGIGEVIEEILQSNYTITYEEKGSAVTKDVSSRIFGAVAVDKDTARVIIATGNDNLRPDRLVRYLMDKHGLRSDYGIVKTRAFVDGLDADEYLEKLQQQKSI
ncbi:MAG: DUF2344 domain-containing protein [Clostridiales bacterium]|nr:DUF2344 domain-containing protein [Clostridiales bacterium]